MPCSTSTTLRRASAHSRSCRSSSTSRSSAVRACPSALSPKPEARRPGSRSARSARPGLDPQVARPTRGRVNLGHAGPYPSIATSIDGPTSAVALGSSTRTVVPAPGALCRRDLATVRDDDGPHDREAEAGTAARGARRDASAAREPLERARGDARRSCPGRRRAPRRPRARRRCGRAPTPGCRPACAPSALPTRLPTTWRSRSSSPSTVTPSATSAVTTRSGATARASAAASTPEHAEVDRVAGQRPTLVEAGEQQQVVDQRRHPHRLLLGAAHRLVELGGVVEAAVAVQLGVAADRRDRRAQLVRRVGDEPAQPRLATPSARRTRPRSWSASR